MPYTVGNPPDYVKGLPKGAVSLCVSAFNSVFERTQDEDKARMACWGAVKTKYEKRGDEWVRKAVESQVDLEQLSTVYKAYALHNKIHAEYLDARWSSRQKAQIAADHEAIVRRIFELGGHHIPKGDALDNTLPEELREAKLRYVVDGFVLSEEKPYRSEIQVLRVGSFHHPLYGKFEITDDDIANMVKNFHEARPKPPTEMVVDWEHMSTTEPPQVSPAAGWVKDLAQREGLFATVEWTDEAAEQIKKREYRYVSPEFNLHYKDKETGKDIGPTLLSIALTNRPFLEGMTPVALSEKLSLMLLTEESLYDQQEVVRRAYYAEFAPPSPFETRDYISDVYEDFVIVEHEGELYKIPYTREDSKVTFRSDQKVKVELKKIYEEVKLKELEFKEWDAKYINDLPDSCFAYIKPGGEKDDEGKTVPRALRFLPFKGANGEVDLSHLRNALSRLPQTKLSPEEKAKARKVLVAAARKEEVGEYKEWGISESEWNEVEKEVQKMHELAEILGVSEDKVLETVKSLKTEEEKLTAAEGRITELEGKLTASETKVQGAEKQLTEANAQKVIEDAIKEGKLLPKQAEWAKNYHLRDPEGFKTYLGMVEKVGPDLHIKGQEGGGEGAVQLTDKEKEIAEKMGVSEEALRKFKEEQAK